jgi:dethiobiotin synthetase
MKRRFDFFITGTDTNVGKTFVTAVMLSALRADSVDAVAMKPVQTGAKRGRSPDLDFCARAAAWKFSRDEIDDLCPCRLPLPASPHLAARIARKKIEPEKIIAAFRQLQRRHDAVLVEGAGGLLVPFRDGFFQRDLISALGIPAIVVARPGLGTLNHTLLTVESLWKKKIPIAAVVLSGGSPKATTIEKDNEEFLRRFLRPVPVLVLKRIRMTEIARAGRALLDGLDVTAAGGVVRKPDA